MNSWPARSIRIIGVPMDLGQQRRGVDMGPSAVRYAGLYDRLVSLGHSVEDAGNLVVPDRDVSDVRAQRDIDMTNGDNIHHLAAVAQVCEQLFALAQNSAQSHELPIFLGGDHAIAIGTVSGLAAYVPEPLGLIWIDAHGDFNTPATSPTGNIHGMPVAVLTGSGHPVLVNQGKHGQKIPPEHIVMIGVRNLDKDERPRLAESGIRVFTMRDIDENGMASIARQALAHLQHVPRLHVSLDMDALDPSVAPGVGTSVPGGISFREAHLLMEILAESDKLAGIDIVEINPILDDGNRTSELAVELTASLLGQRIL